MNTNPTRGSPQLAERATLDPALLLNALLDTEADAIFVKDADGRYLLMNRRGAEVLGLTPDQVCRARDTDIFSPATAATIRRTDGEVLTTGTAARYDLTINVAGEDRIFESVKFPLEIDGDVAGVIGISRDVTEQRLLLQRAEASEEKLRTIIDTLPECVKIVSPDGELLDMNGAGLAMLEAKSLAELRTGRLEDLVLPPWRTEYYRAHNSALTGRRALPVRLEIKGLKGRRRTVEMHAVPLFAPDGSVAAVLSITHDITEAIAAQERMRELQDELIHIARVSAMGSMAVTLAHELNQPLTAIKNFANGLQRLSEGGNLDLEQLRTGLADIGDSATRASEVIRRVREMTRRGEAHWEEIAVASLVAETVRLAKMSSWTEVEIDQQVAPGTRVLGDRVQLQQVLFNLIQNAFEAYDKGARPEVTIAAAAEGDIVVIRVEDHGRGIPDATLDSLFEPFVTSKERGLGVGLSISRTIIEAHKGTIRTRPNAGGGTIFTIRLPKPFLPASGEGDRA